MNSKILLLSIAVIAVGLFAMPSTLSLFAGQHTFTSGANVSCAKCHQDIVDEASSQGQGASFVHYTIMNTSNSGRAQCRGCHTTGTVTGIPVNGTFLSGTYSINITTNPNAHAAVTLECVACHTGVPAALTGSQEAHTPFYKGSWNANGSNSMLTGWVGPTSNQTNISLNGANTACVGCHTHIWVNVTWVRAKGYNLFSNESTGSYVLSFTVNNSGGYSTTYSAAQ